MKVQSVYTSKFLKSGLEFAYDNSALFAATTSLVLSVAARPVTIALTPGVDEENKKYAVAKSIASSAVGYAMMLFITKPFAKAINNIDSNYDKFLNQKTIEALKGKEENLLNSRDYNFATKSLKLGLGFFAAAPKSSLTGALTPVFMKKMFPLKKEDDNSKDTLIKQGKIDNFKKQINFKGNSNDLLSGALSKIINSDSMINLSKKYSNTNLEQHVMNLTDVVSTGAFIFQTTKNKKINKKRKPPLIYNSIISTLLSITGGYALNRAIDKPIQKFVEKFKTINKNDPKLYKYLEGIKVARPALILGGIYYILIPLISTFASDKLDKIKNKT